MSIKEVRLIKVSEFVEADHFVKAICNNCGHSSRLDFTIILEKYGDIDFDEYRKKLPSFACRKCGKKDAALQGGTKHIQPMGHADFVPAK
ncbi:MAG: hypothetical protein HRU29_04600 [Rhizobiales bacterium]|nr:hypothetical protein [Hyphomicrobiales bacterium]NRB13663.1 hypothetical protein [Hyphomicrobiales bacterium]